jgi:hypothetical protein
MGGSGSGIRRHCDLKTFAELSDKKAAEKQKQSATGQRKRGRGPTSTWLCISPSVFRYNRAPEGMLLVAESICFGSCR